MCHLIFHSWGISGQYLILADCQVGRPRDVRKLRMKDLREALHQAGIHWLREPEEG